MTDENANKIETVHLSVRFGGQKSDAVLRDVSFACPAGAFLAVLGPNGSGKSTLLRSLSGWLAPQRRTVFLDGRDIASFGRLEFARRLAALPQTAQGETAFTVEETVLMGRAPYLRFLEREGPLDRRKAEEAMVLTDTLHLRGRDIGSLSGGELRRVMIAQALAQDTAVLLLDEPTAHLDLAHQRDILVLLKKMQREKGITVVAALHDLNSAARYADRIILLARGRITAAGAPEEVMTRELIQRVYGVNVFVIPHPATGRMVIVEE